MNSRIARPLWIKLTTYGFAAVLLTSLVIGSLAFYRQYASGEAEIANSFRTDAAFIQADMDQERRTTAGVAISLATEHALGELFVSGSHEEFLRRFQAFRAANNASAGPDIVNFYNPSAGVLARLNSPDVFGDIVVPRRQTVVHALKTGEVSTGLEQGREYLSIFSTALVLLDGKVVGAVDVGRSLTNAYFDRLKAALKTDISVRARQNGTFATQNTTLSVAPLLSDVELNAVLGGDAGLRLQTLGDKTVAVGGVAIKDYAGSAIGVLELAVDVTRIVRARHEALVSIALATLAVCVVVMGGFLLVARSLGRSLGGLTGAMRRLAGGDLAAMVPGRDRRDEVGAMANAVQVFKDNAIRMRALEAEQTEAQQRRAAEDERVRAEAEQDASAKAAALVVGSIGRGLERLAGGDLTVRLDAALPPAYETLRGDFNTALG